MEISFIIPAYNEESCIGRCIHSILKEIVRSGRSAEVIIGNNASTDRTKEIASSFQGVRVVYEMRKGTNYARQAGFAVSTGELIANIDADSIVPTGWLDTVFDEFARNKNLVGLSGPYVYYDLPPFSRLMSQLFQAAGFVVYLINRFVLKTGSQLLGGNCVIRRSALQKIGGYDTSFTFFGDDIDTARRLLTVGDVKWTYRLPMYSSGRRIKKEGLIKMAIQYPLNLFSTLVRGKPASKTNVDVRAPSKPL